MALYSLNRTNNRLLRRNENLLVENRRLRDEVGELSIEDESLLHAMRVRKENNLEWVWRIWVPEGHEYRLRGSGGQIPKSGWPADGATIWIRDPGEHVISYRVERDPRDDEWYGSLSLRDSSAGKDRQPWVKWKSTTSTTSGVDTKTQSFRSDTELIEICRHRVSQAASTDLIEDPAEGFAIWLVRDK